MGKKKRKHIQLEAHDEAVKEICAQARRAFLKTMPCLEDITACLNTIDGLPLYQRILVVHDLLVERTFFNAERLRPGLVPERDIGRRVLKTLSVLWMDHDAYPHLYQKEYVIKHTSSYTDISRKRDSARYLSFQRKDLFVMGVDALLTWGVHEEAFDVTQNALLPALGEEASWETGEGASVAFLKIFCTHQAWTTLQQKLGGTLDLRHRAWRGQDTFLAERLTKKPSEREAFRHLLVPHIQHTLEDIPLDAREAVMRCCVSLFAKTLTSGLFQPEETAKPARLLALYETFPWMRNSIGQTITQLYLQERFNTETPQTHSVTSREEEEGDPDVQEKVQPLVLQNTHEAILFFMIDDENINAGWKEWGAHQETARQEALLWMKMTVEYCSTEKAREWLRWAQQHGVSDTWWQEKEGAPGLLTALVHTANFRHNNFTRLSPGEAFTQLKTCITHLTQWRDLLEETYPEKYALLQHEMKEALSPLLFYVLALEDPLYPEEQKALFLLGKRVGLGWWETPLPLTLEKIDTQVSATLRTWKRKAFPYDITADAFERLYGSIHEPRTPLDLVREKQPLIPLHYDEAHLSQELTGNPDETCTRKARVRL